LVAVVSYSISTCQPLRGQSSYCSVEIDENSVNLRRTRLSEALAYGYDQVALVTTMRAARGIDSKVFDKLGLVLLGVDSKGEVKQVYPTYG
jgi:hypothetical protein